MRGMGSHSTLQFATALLIACGVFGSRAFAQLGACCLNDLGSALCVETDQMDCDDSGGCWLGEGSACATTICQVGTWNMALDQGQNTLRFSKFDNKQSSHILERLAARIDCSTTQSIQLEILPERRTCLSATQTRVDIRMTVSASAPTLNLFPPMLPLDLSSGFPWLPGLSNPRYCGDPKDPSPVICPVKLSPPPPMCDFGGDFSYAGTDSFLLVDDEEQFGDISHDGDATFDVVVFGDAYFYPYASLTVFSNPVNEAEGVVILGYGFVIVNGACCMTDGECQYITRPDCVIAGGLYQGDELACEVPILCVGACCLSSEPCQLITSDECSLLAGNFLGVGSNCDFPNGCVGACCLLSGGCEVTTQEDCSEQCGEFLGENAPCPFVCSIVTKDACCLPDGLCEQLCPFDCEAAGGTSMGPQSHCDVITCPKPTGACCLADGNCNESNESACQKVGGTYQGHGSQCSTTQCPQPAIGACCLADGSCAQGTVNDCTAMNGVYQGDDITCALTKCPIPGACCMPDQSCTQMEATDCQTAGGTYQGDLSLCGDINCPAPCVADLNQTGEVNIADLFGLLSAWGPCPEPCAGSCFADISNSAGTGTDCVVDVFDLLRMLSDWGVCD